MTLLTGDLAPFVRLKGGAELFESEIESLVVERDMWKIDALGCNPTST